MHSAVSFQGEALRLLAIWDVEVAEDKRLERHDAWLMKELGVTSKIFDWGKVDSVTEPNGAHIVLFSYS